MPPNSLSRLSYVDVLKILATFSIVVLHVSALYVRMDAQLVNPSGALPYVLNTLTRVALPLFMMISGALLLRDNYSFKMKEKIIFMLKVYALWSLFYMLLEQAFRLSSGAVPLSATEMLKNWICGPYHFWYLQMLIGFYLLMPLLERLKGLRTLNYATLLAFVVIYIYGPFAPHLPASLQPVITQIILVEPGTVLFFFLLGACVHRVPYSKKLAAVAALMTLVGLGLRLYLLFTAADYSQASALQPHTSYSELLLATGIFYLARYLCRHYNDGPRMQYLSKSTLRIYVSSALWIFLFERLLKATWDTFVSWPTLTILIWSVVVFLLSWLTAHLLTLKDRALRGKINPFRRHSA